jgi:DNA invertase Pin-like site-specific DNA recombinase
VGSYLVFRPLVFEQVETVGLTKMRAAIYCRVSTIDQNAQNQEKLCRAYCAREGIEVYRVYTDAGISGTKESRPSFNELLTDMRQNKFNCLVLTKLDRMGRSLQHLLSIIEELNARGIHFTATTQGIDTHSAAGKLQLQIMAAFAEFERNIISERTKESLQFAKNVGKRGPDKRPRKKRGVLRARLGIG